MHFVTRAVVAIRESCKGQTMTEYALIVAAVAVVVFAGYEATGTNVQTLLNSIDTQL